MKAEIRLVTPSIAREWLKTNESNRTLRPQRVRQYANDMRAGKWNLTGQGITFGKDGNLLDGQHRLHAIILSDTSVRMLVVTDADVCGTYDGNLVRSCSDKFKLMGKSNIPLYSTNGLSLVRLSYLILLHGGLTTTYNPTFEELSTFIDENYDDLCWITELCSRGGHGTKQTAIKGLRRGIVGATLYSIHRVCRSLSKYDVEHIYRVLQTGLSEYEYDASIIAMRNKLITTVGGGTDVNKELFLRIQYMCKQYINRRPTFKSWLPSNNIFNFTKES